MVRVRLSRHPEVLAALLAGAVPLVPVLLGRRFMGRDHTLIQLGAECARRDGDGLLIDRALGGGSPFLEDPVSQVFYPITWLLRPFGAELAASLSVVVHVALAAACAVLLGRAMNLRRPTALAFGLAHALSGTVMDLILHGPFLVAAAWVPLSWAGARRALRDGDPRSGLAMLSAGIALLLTGGEPQSAMIAGAIAVGEGAALWLRGRALPARERFVRLARVALAIVVGALLAGAQLGATLGISSAMARATGTKGTPLVLPFRAIDALGVVWSNVLMRRTSTGATLFTSVLGDLTTPVPWNLTPYLGLLTLGVFLAGAQLRVRRTALGVAAVSGIFALGAPGLVLPVAMKLLPPLALFRYPAKYLAPFSLAALLVAAATLQLAVRSPAARRVTLRWLAAASLAGLGGFLFVVARGAALDAAARAGGTTTEDGTRPTLSSMLATESARAALVAALGAMLVASRRRALAVALLAVDLAASFVAEMPAGLALTDAPNPRVRQLPGPDRAMVCHGRGLEIMRLYIPGEDLGVTGAMIASWVDLVANVQQCGGPAVPQHYLPSAQGPTVRAVYDLLDERLPQGVQVARALGCTHIVSRATNLPTSLRPLPAFRFSFAARAYAITSPLPDISVARSPALLPSGDAALDRAIAQEGTAGVTAAIDDPAHALRAPLPDGRGATGVAVAWSSAEAGVVRVEGAGGAVVVMRRAWWPGYRATQRGRPIPVVRAGGVNLALVVDDVSAGEVSLRYEARGLRAGIAASALGAVSLVALLAARRRRRA